MTGRQALYAAVLAGTCVVAGVAVLAGLGWALIAAGGWITAAAVVLYDPNSERKAVGAETAKPRIRAVGNS